MRPDEPHRIYAAIFGRPIPPIVLQRFAVACELLHRSVTPEELDVYYRAIAAADDLEALEVAARYTRRLPLLTRKFRLMAALAETLPENQSLFVSERPGAEPGSLSRLTALWTGAGGALRTAYKLAKGLWLLRRATDAQAETPHA